MEHKIAGFAPVALLCSHPPITTSDSPATLAQVCRSCVEHVIDGRRALPGAVGSESIESTGSGGWAAPKCPPVQPTARQDASDDGNTEQEVHGRKPRRRKHIEETQPVQDGTPGRIPLHPVGHADRIQVTLGKDRSRDGRDGQQEEQDEGDPHTGQLAPAPAQETSTVERRWTGRLGGHLIGRCGHLASSLPREDAVRSRGVRGVSQSRGRWCASRS